MMEMIKVGTGAATKKALALVKKRHGSMRRAKSKRVELENAVQSMKRREEDPKEEHKKEVKKADK